MFLPKADMKESSPRRKQNRTHSKKNKKKNIPKFSNLVSNWSLTCCPPYRGHYDRPKTINTHSKHPSHISIISVYGSLAFCLLSRVLVYSLLCSTLVLLGVLSALTWFVFVSYRVQHIFCFLCLSGRFLKEFSTLI